MAAAPVWKKAHDDWAVASIQAGLRTSGCPIEKRALGLLPYRPDLLGRIGPAALRHGELRAVLRSSPACALALVAGFYEETAEALEPTLEGSGESIYHLLHWAAKHGRALRQPESFYRRTLIQDSYWGLRHAHRTQNASLLADVTAWCADERFNYAAAAAFFLIRNPREPLAPYRDVLTSNPFYAYLSLPRLSSRGFSVEPEDIGKQPKWACHFALSALASRPDEFVPGVAGDPGWLIELAVGRGWLDQTSQQKDARRLIAPLEDQHPLWHPVRCFLDEAAKGCSVDPENRAIPLRSAAPSRIPLTLMSGQAAEAQALDALRISKNTDVWRPSPQQVKSPAFSQIVGPPQFTARGLVRGTVVDSSEEGLAEIKSGSSVLNSTYQLRLQTFRSVIEEQPLKIYTNRPIDIQFGHWLSPWGVKIEPMPDPHPQ